MIKPKRMTIGLGLITLFAVSAIVVAPSVLDHLSKQKQKQTVADVRNVGTAMYAWLTDRVEESAYVPPTRPQESRALHSDVIDVSALSPITAEELSDLLVPTYIDTVPRADPWGNPYDFYLTVEAWSSEALMLVRSSGADGVYSGDTYEYCQHHTSSGGGSTVTVGEVLDFSGGADFVWVDGFFASWIRLHR